MGAIRATAAAVLILAGVAEAAAECITDARQISSRTAVPNLVPGPVAWSGLGLAVAKSEEADSDSIWVAIYDEMLETLTPDTKVADDAADSQSIIDLIWNGTEYGLFYRTDTNIHLQRLSISGEPIGGPVDIDTGRGVRFGQDNEVEWSNALNGWVLARHIATGPQRGLWVLVLERDGAMREAVYLGSLPDPIPYLELAVTESGIVGIFNVTSDGNVLHYTRYVPGVLFPDTMTIAPSGEKVQVRAVGENFVVTRLASDIRWQIINSDGEIVKADKILVAADGDVLLPGALSHAGDELAFTYARSNNSNELDFHLLRFTADGTVISDTFFAAADLRARFAYSSHAPAWTGMSWVIAASRDSEASEDAWLERYCPLVVQILGEHVVHVGEPLTLVSNVEGGVPDYQYLWTFTRNPGGPNRLPTATRTFNSVGSSIATLTVTDLTGETTTTQFLINVTDEPDPEPEPIPKRRRAVRK